MNGNFQVYAMKKDWTPIDEAAVLRMDWSQRAELAKFITCPGLLVDLSLDIHAEVRKGAAQNPHTPVSTLKRLADQDICSSVQKSASQTLQALIHM